MHAKHETYHIKSQQGNNNQREQEIENATSNKIIVTAMQIQHTQ